MLNREVSTETGRKTGRQLTVIEFDECLRSCSVTRDGLALLVRVKRDYVEAYENM